jgi:hypothetical protein
VLKDTLWGKASAGLDNLYTFVFAVDTGKLGTSKNSWLVYSLSDDGVTNFQWQKVFEMVRPGGQATGSMNLTNNFRFIQDPGNAERWIGLMAWTFNDGTDSDSGTTPIYILPNQQRFGILFEDAGWCEFNMFTRFTGFSDVNACEGGNFLRFGSTWQGPLGDRFYKAPGLDKDVADLSLIDGKALVLKDIQLGVNGHRCASYWLYGYGDESECALAHESCGPNLDTTLYYLRSRDSEITDQRKPRRWTVREMDFSTWNTSLTALSWNGGATTIQDGGQGLAFKINPTDNPTVGGFHGGQLVQHVGGSIYLYLPIKRTLCEPTESPHAGAWNRWPAPTSGNGSMWLKLSSSG